MLKSLPHQAILMIFGGFLLIVLGYFAIGTFQQDSIVVTANETIRATAFANRDDSARINPGQFRLQKESFERDFIETFTRNVGAQSRDFEITFDYLEDGEGGVRGIRVFIYDGETTFQSTLVVEVAED